MKAYRLRANDNLPTEIEDYLWDVDYDFTNKNEYIKYAKKLTVRTNAKFNTNYKWDELFERPLDIGWRYCTRCKTFYWGDDRCECD